MIRNMKKRISTTYAVLIILAALFIAGVIIFNATDIGRHTGPVPEAFGPIPDTL